jgi:hypothetical protein
MTDFWLDSPESLIFINLTNLNGILNFITLLVIIITIPAVYFKLPNALNIGMLAIIILIIISRCAGSEHFEGINEWIQSPFVDRTDRLTLESEFKPGVIEGTKPCRPATKDNPFGNPNLTDFGVAQKYSGICQDKNSETVQNEVLNDGIFMNSNDYVWRRNQQSRWNSVAGGTVPNDQTAFANWCFNDHNNCKAGSIFMKNPELAKDFLNTCTPDLDQPQMLAYQAPQSDYAYSMLYPSQGGASVFPK